MGTVWWQARLV